MSLRDRRADLLLSVLALVRWSVRLLVLLWLLISVVNVSAEFRRNLEGLADVDSGRGFSIPRGLAFPAMCPVERLEDASFSFSGCWLS